MDSREDAISVMKSRAYTPSPEPGSRAAPLEAGPGSPGGRGMSRPEPPVDPRPELGGILELIGNMEIGA